MRVVAVELHDQTLVGPRHVDLRARDEQVRGRTRQAGLLAEVEEAPLELGAREGRWLVLAQRDLQCPQAVPASAAGDQPLDRAEIEQLQALRRLESAVELLRPDDLRQVKERPGDACDRDAVPDGTILSVEPASVQHDARSAATPTRGRDVGWVRHGREDPPEGSCASVAQQRCESASKNGSHPTPVARHPSVPNRVDANVQPV
jgi:hypothetical protein